MNKKILYVASGLALIITVIAVVFYLVSGVPVVASDSSITFANKSYTLKWSNKNDGGYVNEYLNADETFDNYHTMITIREVTQMKNQLQAAQNLYGVFKQNTDTGRAFMASIDQINKDATLVRYCVVAQVPKRNLECNAFNLQQRKSDNVVMIYQYTQRYFESELKLTPDNAKNVLNKVESDFNKIKPYITNVNMPDIVQKVIDAPASYAYGVKK